MVSVMLYTYILCVDLLIDLFVLCVACLTVFDSVCELFDEMFDVVWSDLINVSSNIHHIQGIHVAIHFNDWLAYKLDSEIILI